LKALRWSENPMEQKPSVYIMAPTLSGISSEGLLTKITGWRGGALSVTQTGKTVLLTDNQFDTLRISAHAGGLVDLDANNVVGEGTLLVRDFSRGDIRKDVFKTFRMQVDTTAHVSLPGSMLKGSL